MIIIEIMHLFNLCNENNHIKYKYVRFDTIVKIILIPSIYDDYIKKNKDSIWYNDRSYQNFINNEKKRLFKRK